MNDTTQKTRKTSSDERVTFDLLTVDEQVERLRKTASIQHKLIFRLLEQVTELSHAMTTHQHGHNAKVVLPIELNRPANKSQAIPELRDLEKGNPENGGDPRAEDIPNEVRQ